MAGSADAARNQMVEAAVSGAAVTVRPPFALYPPRTDKGLDPTRPDEFARRLAEFRRRHATLPNPRLAGSLHILGLEQIRLRFGRRWPELREKAFQIIEHGLFKALGPHDLYVVADEKTILVLASGRRLDAQAHIELLAAELTARLCGLAPGGIAIRCRSLPFDLLRGLAGVTSLAALRERIAECERAAETAERLAFSQIKERLVVGFEPILHPRKRLVAAHRLQACRQDRDQALRLADLLFEDRVVGVFDALVDLWLLERSAEQLATAVSRTSTLVVPLRAETLLALSSRDRYLATCRRLPKSSNRHLLFEITELPGAMPQARVREVIGYLAPFALGVAVRLYGSPLLADHLEGAGARFVSIHDGERRGPLQPLGQFAKLARDLRMRAVCLGVADENRLREALAARIDYVAGPAIAMLRTTPLGRRRL